MNVDNKNKNLLANTVILDLKTYHTLKQCENDLKKSKEIENPKHTVLISRDLYRYQNTFTDDDAVYELSKNLDEAYKEINLLKQELFDLKKMTCKQFRKWRNSTTCI